MQKNLQLLPLNTLQVIGDIHPLDNEDGQDYITQKPIFANKSNPLIFPQDCRIDYTKTLINIEIARKTSIQTKKSRRAKFSNCQDFTEAMYLWSQYLNQKFNKNQHTS